MALQEKGTLGVTQGMLEFFLSGKNNLDIFLHGLEAMREPWEIHKDKVLVDWVKDRPERGRGHGGNTILPIIRRTSYRLI